MSNSNASPTVKNSTFSSNSSGTYGGGIFNYFSSLTITNSTFSGNNAESGGGMFNYSSNPTITNSTFSGNSAERGGGMCNQISSSPTVTNSIFWNNSASSEGDEIYNEEGFPTFSYCDIKGSGGSGDSWDTNFGSDGSNNIDSDPMFATSSQNTSHPYSITGASPCADAGNNDANSEPYDIRGVGFARELNKNDGTIGTIDIGAYEYKLEADPLPVTLTSFTAEIIEEGVLLKWETATEVNNYGFEIERALNLRGLANLEGFTTIGFVEGHGNCNSPKQYEYIDTEQITDSTEYRLKQIDTDGAFTYYAKTVKVGNSITSADNETLPKEFKLSQNYPNPFNPTTIINYGLKSESNVQLTVYNTLGQKVITLVNKHQQAGNYTVNFDASNLSSGTYIYRITAGEFVSVKKLVLIK